jgi:hypothetical protein
MRKRDLFRGIAVATGTCIFAFFCISSDASPKPGDYSRLVEFLNLQQQEESPLYAFNTFEDDVTPDSPQTDLRFFNEHPTLVRNIRNDLGNGSIQWRLEHSRHRLLFVPETREAFARLFEGYCRDVIDYILRKTDLENPYVTIETLLREKPDLSQSGVHVFLVHNLAKEVVGTYVFSNPIRESIMIEISRKTFLGEVGSYTTNIRFRPSGEPEFLWDSFTVWQTTAKNPFAVLCVPVEETLHIALRDHTHRVIQQHLDPEEMKDAAAPEAVVDDWMAVEEALVGGVTYALLPSFLKRTSVEIPDSLIEEEIDSRTQFSQYRHLRNAIEAVHRVGYKNAIRMYQDHPENFRELLLQVARKDTSAG